MLRSVWLPQHNLDFGDECYFFLLLATCTVLSYKDVQVQHYEMW